MFGRDGIVVHIEELDDEVMVGIASRRTPIDEATLTAVAREFAGPGRSAELISRTPIALQSHLRYVRFVALLSRLS